MHIFNCITFIIIITLIENQVIINCKPSKLLIYHKWKQWNLFLKRAYKCKCINVGKQRKKNKTNLKSTKNYVIKIKKSIKTRYNVIVIELLLNMFEAVSTGYFIVGHQIVFLGEFN